MIGIMTAAGKGSRMKKVTGKDLPKALIGLHGKPIIAYGIEAMKAIGIKKIYIVGLKKYENDFRERLSNFDNLHFCWLEKSNHIMDSLDYLVKNVLKDKEYKNCNAIYWLADNIFIGDDHKRAIKKLNKKIKNTKESTGLLLVETHMPQDFITMKKDGSFEDKPINPETNLSAAGVFVVNNLAMKNTSNRVENKGEFTIWDSWMKKHKLFCEKITDTWVDVGTPERFKEVKKLISKI